MLTRHVAYPSLVPQLLFIPAACTAHTPSLLLLLLLPVFPAPCTLCSLYEPSVC
jgi:hypothetical protein